jgi:OST-HTH/LOTUS domain
MIDPSTIATDLSRLVQSSPNSQILGSALAVLIKRVHPDFQSETFGCRNLRDFIRRYAKDIFEAARRGGDIVYSTALMPATSVDSTRVQEFRRISAVPAPVRQLTISTPVWKTFASPNAFYRIFANRETGEFRTLRRIDDPLDDPWVQVQSCSPASHLQIAREFVENLADESTKSELSKILGLESWWGHFFVATRGFGIERLWSGFRRRKLHVEFEQQLKSLGVPAPFSIAPAPIVAGPPVLTAPGPPPELEGDDVLRRLASAIINRLPTSDLREVWVPLGYVLDEIGKGKL